MPGCRVDRDRDTVVAADAVQQQVHGAEPGDAVHDLDAAAALRTSGASSGRCRARSAWLMIVMRGQQEAARAAGRIADGLARRGAHHVHHGADQRRAA